MSESPGRRAASSPSTRIVVLFSVVVLVLSSSASVAGALSIGGTRYRSFTTVRSERVEVADSGVYRNSVRALVTGGTPWDVVRLAVGIPLLLAALVLHLRSSIRGTVLFIGALASFLYQYLLWTFDWAYNSFYLAYVLIFSLSLCTLVLVVADFDAARVNAATGKAFPRKRLAVFCFAIAGMLAFKCLGEILPGVRRGTLPASATGHYTLVDQGLDLGILVPACIFAGVLVLRRSATGVWLASSLLVIALTIGLSVVAGEAVLGFSTGTVNVTGLAIFTIFLALALALLIVSLRNIRDPSTRLSRPAGGTDSGCLAAPHPR